MNNDMNEKDKLDGPKTATEQTGKESGAQTDGQGQAKNFTLMFIALGCFAAGVLLFILSFFIKGAGTTLIIASMILSLACASFLNGQKRKAYSNACKVLRILCYALMIACVAVVLTGTVLNR